MLIHLSWKWQHSNSKYCFQINNVKLYVPVVTLPINDNVKFLENMKQGFERTISWNKYRSDIKSQPKLIIWII